MKTKPSESNRLQLLNNWYETNYARLLREHIHLQLQQHLNCMVVNDIAHIGLPWPEQQPLNIHVSEQVTLAASDNSDTSQEDYLPLATDSQRCLLYYHVLDIVDQPYQLLREANRVLDDAGYLIIVGLNPWSLFSFISPVARWVTPIPWALKAYSPGKVSEWLQLLAFKACRFQSCGFMPPLPGNLGARFLNKTEVHISPIFSHGGMVYTALFRKHQIPITPIKTRWQTLSTSVPSGALRPTPIRYDRSSDLY